MSERKPCEYCGADLPLGVDKDTRRTRSYHFSKCTARLQQMADAAQQRDRQHQQYRLNRLVDAGFTHEQACVLLDILQEDRDA